MLKFDLLSPPSLFYLSNSKVPPFNIVLCSSYARFVWPGCKKRDLYCIVLYCGNKQNISQTSYIWNQNWITMLLNALLCHDANVAQKLHIDAIAK